MSNKERSTLNAGMERYYIKEGIFFKFSKGDGNYGK